ncbi:hypothetical protein GEMRC1_011276 [Eukaryota sp. GEM-RC1]
MVQPIASKPSKPSFQKKTSKRNNAIRKSVLGRKLENLTSGHRGTFIDKRIGAKLQVDPQEASMMRYIKQKQLEAAKKSQALDNEPEDDEEAETELLLTHGGKALTFNSEDEQDLDSFNPDMDSDEEFAGKGDTSAGLTHAMHFGGGYERTDNIKKSSAEIYAEIIAKSKQSKAEKSVQKIENENLMDKLDNQFDELLSGHVLDQKSRFEADDDVSDEDFSEFNAMAKEFELETKAKALEKSLSDKEKAERMLKKLKALEKDRLEQLEDSASEDEISDEDDVAAEFSEEEGTGSEVEGDDPEAYEESEVEADDQPITQETPVDSHVPPKQPVIHASRLHMVSQSKAPDGLPLSVPFLVELPGSVQELAGFLSKHEVSTHTALLNRMYQAIHPSLGGDSKEKAKKMLVLVFQYHDYLLKNLNLENFDEVLEKVNVTVFVLEKLINFFPKSTGVICQKKLSKISKVIDLSKSSFASIPHHSAFFQILFILNLFPLGQRSHPIVNAAFFVISKLAAKMSLILSKFDYSTASNPQVIELVSKSCFILNIYDGLSRGSKRFFPETFKFSANLFKLLISISQTHSINCEQFNPKVSFSAMIGDESVSPSSLIVFALSCIKNQFSRHLLDSAFPMLAQSLIDCKSDDLPEVFSNFITYLEVMSQKSVEIRRPLCLQSLKPRAIKQFKPSFSLDYDPEAKGSLDGDMERKEQKRFEHLFKKEHKGAIREVKKDASFIASQKNTIREFEIKKSEDSRKRIFSELQKEAAEYNKMDREKDREKSRERMKKRSRR